MRDLNMSADNDGDPRRRINVIYNNSDVRMLESKINQMSPISNRQSVRDAASPMILSESSTHDQIQLQNPLIHEDERRQYLLKNADKLVKESKLTQKIKIIACQLGLLNMKKSSVH